jgi:hypothetical protein
MLLSDVTRARQDFVRAKKMQEVGLVHEEIVSSMELRRLSVGMQQLHGNRRDKSRSGSESGRSHKRIRKVHDSMDFVPPASGSGGCVDDSELAPDYASSPGSAYGGSAGIHPEPDVGSETLHQILQAIKSLESKIATLVTTESLETKVAALTESLETKVAALTESLETKVAALTGAIRFRWYLKIQD